MQEVKQRREAQERDHATQMAILGELMDGPKAASAILPGGSKDQKSRLLLALEAAGKIQYNRRNQPGASFWSIKTK